MEITLANHKFQARISSHGAQLLSFRNLATGTEHIWNGNPDVWKFRAPILFPIVGRLKDGFYRRDGKQYFLANHGFVRDLEHELAESSSTRALWRLTQSPETLRVFPWPFVFRTEYRLEGSTLVFCTTVTNSGGEDLSFSMGSHTALVYPWSDFSKEDFVIQFEKDEAPDFVQSSGTGFVLGSWKEGAGGEKVFVPQTIPYPHIQQGRIAVQDGFFAGGHILANVASDWVALVHRPTGECIKVNAAGCPYLVLWQSPSAQHPFVCIEPWFGLPDFEGTSQNWEEKPGLVHLPPGKSFATNQSLVFDSI